MHDVVRFDESHRIFDGVFTATDMTEVAGGLTRSRMQRTKAGAGHVLSAPVVRDLAADPRLLEIARGFVGDEATAFRATLFDKSPSSNWLAVSEAPRRVLHIEYAARLRLAPDVVLACI